MFSPRQVGLGSAAIETLGTAWTDRLTELVALVREQLIVAVRDHPAALGPSPFRVAAARRSIRSSISRARRGCAMDRPDWKGALGEAFAQALSYLDGLPDRPVHPAADLGQLRAALGGPLPERPLDARDVVADLAAAAGPGVIASGSGRFFGFVVGGTTPAALAADWLTSTWDQNAGLYVLGPAAAVVEEVAGAWMADLLGLPPHVSVGYVTGAQMANVTALAAALHAVLGRAGWEVSSAGLWGAPRVRVLAGEQRHGTVDRALGFLGVGTAAVEPIPADAQGRMRVDALASAFDEALDDRPAIVCAQVGNVNTGAVDPVGQIRTSPTGTARGCTSTARSGCGRRRARGCGRWWPASGGRTRGRPTRTSGSTCPTTAAWSSVLTRRHIGPRWARGRAISCTAREASATLSTTIPSTPGVPAGSPCTPCCGRWGAAASPTWSSAAARWPAGSPRSSARPRA
jgi:hypothetical protein